MARLIIDECKKLAEKEREQSPKKRGRTGFVKLAADMLGVSPLTVEVWMRGDCQASNAVAKRLVNLAMELNEKDTKRIVREALSEHQERLKQWLSQS